MAVPLQGSPKSPRQGDPLRSVVVSVKDKEKSVRSDKETLLKPSGKLKLPVPEPLSFETGAQRAHGVVVVVKVKQLRSKQKGFPDVSTYVVVLAE